MASGPELELGLVGLQVDQAWKQEDHVTALVHDGRMAVVAADFARHAVGDVLVGRVVPFEVVMTAAEVDVGLVEDGSPLEGSSYDDENRQQMFPVSS